MESKKKLTFFFNKYMIVDEDENKLYNKPTNFVEKSEDEDDDY